MSPGRLSATCTGDGKRRIFAIGNYIKQRLLYPFHEWLASVLRSIPMDGTFDQLAPLDRLKGVSSTVYSVDLKAATDRWPISLLIALVRTLFGERYACAAPLSALYKNAFEVPFLKNEPPCMFEAGQPLGYYSSWPLFALSHHLLIWQAAEKVRPGRIFRRYAILGDDVVIADSAVYASYIDLLNRLPVKTSPAKSLTSPTGAAEFAKKFRLDRLQYDLSGLSLKKLIEAFNPLGWYNMVISHHRVLRTSTWLRLAGFGYRAAARPISVHGKFGRRFNRSVVLMMYARSGSIELALIGACGKVLTPCVRGSILRYLFEAKAPKDLEIVPAQAFTINWYNDEYVLERTLYYSWMEQYLAYCKWYYQLMMNPEVGLDDFMSAPMYVRTWYSPNVDKSTFRFGIMFRLYDRVQHNDDQFYRELSAPTVGIV